MEVGTTHRAGEGSVDPQTVVVQVQPQRLVEALLEHYCGRLDLLYSSAACIPRVQPRHRAHEDRAHTASGSRVERAQGSAPGMAAPAPTAAPAPRGTRGRPATQPCRPYAAFRRRGRSRGACTTARRARPCRRRRRARGRTRAPGSRTAGSRAARARRSAAAARGSRLRRGGPEMCPCARRAPGRTVPSGSRRRQRPASVAMRSGGAQSAAGDG